MNPGRQRSFDVDIALNKAMRVFWSNGYSGTSMSDLTEAMGINKPSLYAVFGNKESLFSQVLKHYVATYGPIHQSKLTEQGRPLKERLRANLLSIIDTVSNPELPGGCFMAKISGEFGSNCLPELASETVIEINKEAVESLITFFREEKERGYLQKADAPEVLADYLQSLQYGLATMARNGVSKSRLNQVVDQALTGLLT